MKILVVGDSHSQYFGITPQLRAAYPALTGTACELRTVHGATITGFGKRASSLGTRNVIVALLKESPPDFLVLNFGQVDIELGIPYRKYMKFEEINLKDIIRNFVEIYRTFIESLDFPNDRILVKGVNLSVLVHDRNKAIQYIKRIVAINEDPAEEETGVIERMKADFPNDFQRDATVRHFNACTAEAMAAIGVSYFDLNAALFDERTGLISSRYIPSGRDHHLVDSVEVRKMHWQALLREINEKYSSGDSYPSVI